MTGQTIVHLVTQRDQPYGSVRRCCEECGRVPWLLDAHADDPSVFKALPEGFVACSMVAHADRAGVDRG